MGDAAPLGEYNLANIEDVCFFNYFHNGDCLATKEFVKEFISVFPNKKFKYSHVNNKKVLLDLSCEYVNLKEQPKIPHNEKFIIKDNILYINTWVGAYLGDENLQVDGINWLLYHKIWQSIHEVCATIFNSGAPFILRNVEDYAYSIDYSKFDCSSVDRFIAKTDGKKIVLISNGLVHSAQSYINDDMHSLVRFMAKRYPDKLFICTKKINFTNSELDEEFFDNVFFTDNIIENAEGCDLNEISYLSKFADVVIGRNSGAFMFAHTKENLLDVNKKFLAFGKHASNCFAFKLKFPCIFKFVEDTDINVMVDATDHILNI